MEKLGGLLILGKNEKIEEKKDWQKYFPICPHCFEEIKKLNAYVIPLSNEIDFSRETFIGKRNRCIVTSCPHCRKIIGTYDYYEK